MNKFIGNTLGAVVSPKWTSFGLLVLRVFAGAMMLTHGIQKAMNYSEMAANFADPIGLGVKFSFTLMMLAEFAGSILVILGLLTRLSALTLVFGMAVAAFIVHTPFSVSGSELPLLYLIIFTTLMISGGGRFSADHYIYKYISASRK